MESYYKIYNKLPVSVQNALVNMYSLKLQCTRYNRQFKKYLNLYDQNIDLDENTFLRIDVNKKLFEFLKKAQNSKYWSEKFKQYNLNISRNVDLKKEINKLPILTKDEVFQHLEDIKTNVSGKTKKISTGGTTGRALRFIQTQKMENKQWAIWWRYRQMYGLTTNTWYGWFGGKKIVPVTQKEPPYWRVDYPGKQIMFSAIHLSKNTVQLYYREIKKRNLTWLHGYPSQLALLASYMLEKDLPPIDSLEIVTTGSESLKMHQKKIIQQAFEVPIREHYGLAEGVANFSEWPDGKMRVDKDFCFVEFIPISKKNPERCKIIGTNYSNPAFPLIRYDTGDIASVKKEDSENIVLSLEGRSDDVIILPNGKKFGRISHIFKKMHNIKEGQVYQPEKKRLIFRIVKNNKYDSSNEEEKLRNEIKKYLADDNVQIDFCYYPQKLPRTSSGKLKTAISDIN